MKQSQDTLTLHFTVRPRWAVLKPLRYIAVCTGVSCYYVCVHALELRDLNPVEYMDSDWSAFIL